MSEKKYSYKVGEKSLSALDCTVYEAVQIKSQADLEGAISKLRKQYNDCVEWINKHPEESYELNMFMLVGSLHNKEWQRLLDRHNLGALDYDAKYNIKRT